MKKIKIKNKKLVILITCALNNDGEYSPQIFLQEALYDKWKTGNCQLLVDLG